MTICFTGTREGMTAKQLRAVAELLRKAKPGRVHHGCCEGADRQFHSLTAPGTRELFPSNREQQDWAQRRAHPGDVIHPMAPPLARNRHMVDRSALVIAAPKTAEEVLRSGTWATIRYARTSQEKRPDLTIVVLEPDEA